MKVRRFECEEGMGEQLERELRELGLDEGDEYNSHYEALGPGWWL